MQPTDIVILSNAPGEVTTWVRPVVKALERVFEDRAIIRISVLLSPCPHSTGKEAEIASSYPAVDRVLPATEFWSFLLWGKTKDNWQWHQRGIVVFLGGDQFYTVAISRRLGYSSLIYTEWDARWYRFVDRFAAMNQKAIAQVPKSYRYKFSLVGDLMADVALEVKSKSKSNPNLTSAFLVGLFVGSKPAKLSQGVPLCLAIAEEIQQQLPQTKFMIPVAPTLDLVTLSNYASRQHNDLIPSLGNVTAELVYSTPQPPYLITSGGTKIELVTEFPAYQTIVDCQLCLTTVGANTAELTALRVPMIVLLPTQQLDAMRSWDGLPGILANLPGIGTVFAKGINWLVLRQGRLFAWPNIWAGTEIVPELVGKLEPETVAQLVLDYLKHPDQLKIMSDRLNVVRGQTGAAEQIADIIKQEITKI
ncbi:lipid-A-disaccharide synthase [Pleurocapsa sp. CCALA 161]|uniref:lipid-A-disaccharide synthase n=1 Tax=Pleurocapsa sp. CCALA 161 TaxID=2107688 RepID=UPI000D06CAA1|nr:lipid-A-disaccharide synthase [Pleurocapsa sp. CCALA 161]PSB12276.1 lipid-A-disaccharide synthase [Pleurocapsa sp. CCALA 161]